MCCTPRGCRPRRPSSRPALMMLKLWRSSLRRARPLPCRGPACKPASLRCAASQQIPAAAAAAGLAHRSCRCTSQARMLPARNSRSARLPVLQVVQQLWGSRRGDGSDLGGVLTARPIRCPLQAAPAAGLPILAPAMRHPGPALPQLHSTELQAPLRQPSLLPGMLPLDGSGSSALQWHITGSSSCSRGLLRAVPGDSRLALPWDLAWLLLLERSVYEAPFPQVWVRNWLEAQLRGDAHRPGNLVPSTFGQGH